jgi:cytosine/adenosine deaminase-related metal-dependent hydrolase
MKSFKADYVFPVCADPIKNGIVTVDDTGKIVSVTDQTALSGAAGIPLKKVDGIICPGFVNTHCHLELSHLKGKINKQTGLIDFIKQVQNSRKTETEKIILDAAAKADETMLENGIVAVADIVNTMATTAIKAGSKLYYHTFVETFGFVPGQAKEVFDKASALLNEFKPQSCSITPHAAYSVSKHLFKLIKEYTENTENLISLHNQESEEENKFYRYKSGAFNDLYAYFGIDINHFKPQARNSLQSVIPLLSNKNRIFLVHNTYTNLKDIYFLKRFDHKINWCFCPNANLYIEGRLPKIELFLEQGYNITLGTDSLASNDNLCILSEMRTLQNKYPSLTTAKLMEWGTINGAKYLGVDDEKGTLEAGKTPGLNLITGLDGLKITPETKVKKLV